MAGYSDTPLLKKLGIKEGHRLHIVDPPDPLPADLRELPPGVTLLASARAPLDVVLLFVTSRSRFQGKLAGLIERLAPAGTIWVCWPKKSSGVATDLNENLIRELALASGVVDVKVCAVDEVWSGLKLVIRLADRLTTRLQPGDPPDPASAG